MRNAATALISYCLPPAAIPAQLPPMRQLRGVQCCNSEEYFQRASAALRAAIVDLLSSKWLSSRLQGESAADAAVVSWLSLSEVRLLCCQLPAPPYSRAYACSLRRQRCQPAVGAHSRASMMTISTAAVTRPSSPSTAPTCVVHKAGVMSVLLWRP